MHHRGQSEKVDSHLDRRQVVRGEGIALSGTGPDRGVRTNARKLPQASPMSTGISGWIRDSCIVIAACGVKALSKGIRAPPADAAGKEDSGAACVPRGVDVVLDR